MLPLFFYGDSEMTAKDLAQAAAPKKKTPATPKAILTVARDSREDVSYNVRSETAKIIADYAKFAGASEGNVLDSLAEYLLKKDKLFKVSREAKPEAVQA